MPRIFASNVRPDLPEKYGVGGSAKYGVKAAEGNARGPPQPQKEQNQQQSLLLRRRLQQQQQHAAASNVKSAFEKHGDPSSAVNDPRADPDYYEYYSDITDDDHGHDASAAGESAAMTLRRQQLLKQLARRRGGARAGVSASASPDYGYGLSSDGGMAGAGTSAIDRDIVVHGGGHGGYLYLEDDCNTGVNPAIALMSLAILGVSTFTIINWIAQNGGGRRRRRRELDYDNDDFAHTANYFLTSSTS